MYKLTDGTTVLLIDGENTLAINADVDSEERRTYLAWLDDGNTPEPADDLPESAPDDSEFYAEYLDMAQEVSADVGLQMVVEVVRGLLNR